MHGVAEALVWFEPIQVRARTGEPGTASRSPTKRMRILDARLIQAASEYPHPGWHSMVGGPRSKPFSHQVDFAAGVAAQVADLATAVALHVLLAGASCSWLVSRWRCSGG